MFQPLVANESDNRRADSVTVAMRLSLRIDQLQVARADKSTQQQVEQSVHSATPASVRFCLLLPVPRVQRLTQMAARLFHIAALWSLPLAHLLGCPAA